MGHIDEGAETSATTEADARVLEAATEILKRRFGMLTAGDLINGLTGAVASIRAQGGIIKPVIPGTTGSNKPRLRRLNEPEDQEEPGHGYWEAGDYP